MIPLKRVDHVSMAAPDWHEQARKLDHLLGFRVLRSWQAREGQDYSGCVSQVPATGVEFEVLEPSGPRSFVQRFLDTAGPGLHHIALEVHDIHETAAEITRLGIEPFGGIVDDGSWLLTYIHPRDSGGILWQLFVPKSQPAPIDRSAGAGVVGFKRMDHVSMAVTDLDRQVEWLEGVLGFQSTGGWTDDTLGYSGCNLSIPGSLLKFEVIAPTRDDSFVQKFISTRHPGMHHICCEVVSVEAAASALRSQGIEPFGGIIRNTWKTHTFLHPRDSGGVLFQLFEEPTRMD